ncbi:MAG: thioredoxin family protein [Betaproteobacteria bacterium]
MTTVPDASSAPPPGGVVDLGAEDFAATLPTHPFAIVDFWAPWCAPCRAFTPVFAGAAARYPDVLFAKVNTEEEQELAGHFNIRSIPTLMVFREGIVVFSQAGALSAGALEQVLTAAKALDMNEVRRELDTKAAKPVDKHAPG